MPIWLITINAKYNGPLEAAYKHIGNYGYDMDKCGAAGQLKLGLSDQLRSCIIGCTHAIHESNSNMFLRYHWQVSCVLEAPHEHIGDGRYDMVEWGPADQLKLDLSDQLRRCKFGSTFAIRTSSAIVLCFYTIAGKYNGSLEAPHAHIDDDR